MVNVITAVQKERGKSALEYLLNSKDEKLKELGEFFAALVRVSFNTPIEIFIDYLIGSSEIKEKDKTHRSNFLNYYAKNDQTYASFTLYENLNVLREAMRAHLKNIDSPKLKDFLDFVSDYTEAKEAIISTSPYQDAADAVQIMTAHKSKGLEFEYVFIIATDDRSWGNAKGNNNLLFLPANLAEIRHTGIEEDECLRLFFVAITRAKKHLILTNSIKDFSGKKPARLEYLSEYEDEKGEEIISPFLPKVSRLVEKHYAMLPEDAKLSNLKNSWVISYNNPDSEINDLLKKRLENYRLTATDLTNFIDISYGGPQEFYKQRVLRAPDESYSETLSFGNLIHATFEATTNENLSKADAIKLFKEKAISAAIPQEDLENILERGEQSLSKSLDQFDKILKNSGARAEVNFSSEHLSLNNIPLTGKIDHINIDETNKTIEVYDFKTSGFKEKNWNTHPTLYKYRLQLGFYKLLLNLSPTYSKYKVEKAHILFVVPDSIDAKVHDKVYEYNAKDEEELKTLIKSVYAHIKTLDFVNNKELFISHDTNKKFPDVKEFIKLVLDTTPNL